MKQLMMLDRGDWERLRRGETLTIVATGQVVIGYDGGRVAALAPRAAGSENGAVAPAKRTFRVFDRAFKEKVAKEGRERHKAGVTLREIGAKYNVAESLVRQWSLGQGMGSHLESLVKARKAYQQTLKKKEGK